MAIARTLSLAATVESQLLTKYAYAWRRTSSKDLQSLCLYERFRDDDVHTMNGKAWGIPSTSVFVDKGLCFRHHVFVSDSGPVFCLWLWVSSDYAQPGYWSNLACNWPSRAWAYSKQETENGPRPLGVRHSRGWLGFSVRSVSFITCVEKQTITHLSVVVNWHS